MLGEGPTYVSKGSFATAEQKFSINFINQRQTCWSLHYNGVSSYLYVNKTEIYTFRAHDNILSMSSVSEVYQTFCLR